MEADTEDEDVIRYANIKSALRPLMIISQGSAVIKNNERRFLLKEWENRNKHKHGDDIRPNKSDKELMNKQRSIEITKLATGAVFGESDCLQSIGYEFLGDIYAGKEGMDCLVI